jgi:hypothetical protein
MPLIAENKGKNFEIAKEGTTQAVLAGVKDLGMVDTSFNGVTKKVHKVNFIWELAELDTEGLPKLIFEKFTLSLHPKSQLYKRIKGLFNKEVPATLDLEKLIGTQTQLVLVHNEGKDKNGQSRVYANIAATLKLQPGQGKLEIVPLDKVISKKDDVKQAVAATTAVTAENPIDDMDVPF